MCQELIIVDSAEGILHRVDVDSVIDVSEMHVACVFAVKVTVEAACTSETSETLLVSTRCKDPRTESNVSSEPR
jgi:hypothetical protein